jgi:hypothetical protein
MFGRLRYKVKKQEKLLYGISEFFFQKDILSVFIATTEE